MQGMKFKLAASLFGAVAVFLSTQLHAFTLLPGEILDPGVGVYTITDGTYIQDPGAIYVVSFNSQGGSSEILVTGSPTTAFIEGGILDLQINNADYVLNQPYTILEADGGITGNFGSIFSAISKFCVLHLLSVTRILFYIFNLRNRF